MLAVTLLNKLEKLLAKYPETHREEIIVEIGIYTREEGRFTIERATVSEVESKHSSIILWNSLPRE
jgi:hypothetical protein